MRGEFVFIYFGLSFRLVCISLVGFCLAGMRLVFFFGCLRESVVFRKSVVSVCVV